MNLVLSNDFPSTTNTELVARIRSFGPNPRVAWVAGSVGCIPFPLRLREFAAAGRLVVSATGGAMQLTANVSLFRLLSESVEHVLATRSEFEGLGLVDFELLPHLNGHDQSFLEKVRCYSESVPHASSRWQMALR